MRLVKGLQWLGFMVLAAFFLYATAVRLNHVHAQQQRKKPVHLQPVIPLTKQHQAFIQKVSRMIDQINLEISQKRKQLLTYYQLWHKRGTLSQSQRQWLTKLANQYLIRHPSLGKEKTWQTLLRRVDVIPPSLVLAQAINESAWGTSRFAKQGNNLFGEWCYKPGCGIVPKKRPKRARYEVRKYTAVILSVRDYMHNLNTNRVYRLFRGMRAMMRKHHIALQGRLLANTLAKYSQQGNEYVNILERIIVDYQLGVYDKRLP